MKKPITKDTSKGEMLVALRAHHGENQSECAKRLKRTRQSVARWERGEAMNLTRWNMILMAYGATQEAVDALMENRAKLTPSPVDVEKDRRAAAAAKVALTDDGKYAGREWISREHKEPRWWNLRRYGADPRFFECGEDECPTLAKGQRSYGLRQSSAICILDARDKKGLTTTAEELIAGHITNYKLRVPLSGEAFDAEALDMAQKAVDNLTANGDLLTDENGHLSLAEHVYEAIILCPQGDPRVKFLIKSAKCRPFALFTTLDERGACVIEALDDNEPPPRDPSGPSFEVEEDENLEFDNLETEQSETTLI